MMTVAIQINDEFQHYMRHDLFGDMIDAESSTVEYCAAPVKGLPRCREKIQTDYSTAYYPASARLLDLVRCSFTFDLMSDLVNALHLVQDAIIQPENGRRWSEAKLLPPNDDNERMSSSGFSTVLSSTTGDSSAMVMPIWNKTGLLFFLSFISVSVSMLLSLSLFSCKNKNRKTEKTHSLNE